MLHWIEMFGGNTVSGWEHRLSHAAPLDSHAICFHRMNNAQVDAALVAINARLCSREGVSVDDDGSVKFCAGLGAAKEIQNLLYKSKAWTLAQSLIGRGRVNRVDHAQIALRPPVERLYNAKRNRISNGQPEMLPPSAWHIDGMGKDKHSPFTLLLGVTLSAVPEPDSGNFCVFPGSHKLLFPLLKDQVRRGSALFSTEGDSSKPQLHNGIQVLAAPGDVVMAHQKLAHRGGPNASAGIRYQVYFRLRHVHHEQYFQNGSLLEDLWIEYEGLR
eukprot:m.518412 g.518412  ORF g.518412 m.518412 type:complete len:273 (+) comp21939_c0_seq27:169-987(+)